MSNKAIAILEQRVLRELVTVIREGRQKPLGNREGSQSVRAISRETCLSQYRNEKLPFIHATRNWQYEICKIRNNSGFILLRSEIRSYGSALWS